ISSRKMSWASRRSASGRPDWVAPARDSTASASPAQRTEARARIMNRMASIYGTAPEAERAEDGSDAEPLVHRADVVGRVEPPADVVWARCGGERLLIVATLAALKHAVMQQPYGWRAVTRGSE